MTDQITDAPADLSEDDAPGRPVVRLRPKAIRRVAEGAPWVYGDELALDRRTRALAPGTVATLEGEGRRPLCTVAVNPGGTIAARVLDPDPLAEIDGAWLRARLSRALALRTALYDAPFYRLVHAEGDGLPGLVIDRFGEVFAVQPNAAWADARMEDIAAALRDLAGARVVVMNGMGRTRKLEGLPEEIRVVAGELDAPVETAMNGAIYLADLLGGQKTGLFFDQRPNHAFAARLAPGARVLDVFSHVGGFGLAALAGGAASALAVDSSAPALELAERGAAAMGAADRFSTRREGAFEALAGLAREGARFELVICDPPAFAPNAGARENGLRAYAKVARLAAPLVEGEGWLVLCSCSHAVDLEAFRAACVAGLRGAGRSGALVHVGRAGPDHPAHMALPETSYLKALFFRLDAPAAR